MPFVYAAICALFWLADPTPAYAWGPGTHLEIALTVLKHAAWAAPVIRNLIQTYPAEFIYGHVSPDIIMGKKYAGAIHHCHNWAIGKLILEEADNDMDRAAAWGYLTHLAADCVAHNYFVPYKLIQSFPQRTLGHAYWEMRLDLFVPGDCWKAIGGVIHRDYTSFDHLLDRVLKKTLFSFRTNKKIFNSIMILHKMKQVRFGLRTYARASRWEITPARVKHYKDLMWESLRGFLAHPSQARCLAADPAGTRKLKYAAELRKGLRQTMKRQGIEGEKHLQNFLDAVKGSLECGIYDPLVKLPDVASLKYDLSRISLHRAKRGS